MPCQANIDCSEWMKPKTLMEGADTNGIDRDYTSDLELVYQPQMI
jgi:hypothetical protein